MLGSTAGGRRSMMPFKAMSPGGVDTDLDSSLHEPLQQLRYSLREHSPRGCSTSCGDNEMVTAGQPHPPVRRLLLFCYGFFFLFTSVKIDETLKTLFIVHFFTPLHSNMYSPFIINQRILKCYTFVKMLHCSTIRKSDFLSSQLANSARKLRGTPDALSSQSNMALSLFICLLFMVLCHKKKQLYQQHSAISTRTCAVMLPKHTNHTAKCWYRLALDHDANNTGEGKLHCFPDL